MTNRNSARPSPLERFWSKVDKTSPDECWMWQAGRNDKGYGLFYVNEQRRHAYAHRFAYEDLVGPIPDGAEIDHTCHQPACINPEHLRVATHALNSENRSGPPANNKSGHLGVYFETRGQCWIAQVKHRGTTYSKRFKNKEDAAAEAIDQRNRVFKFNTLDRV